MQLSRGCLFTPCLCYFYVRDVSQSRCLNLHRRLFISRLASFNPLQRYNCDNVTINFFQFPTPNRREVLNILILYILYIYIIYIVLIFFPKFSCYRFANCHVVTIVTRNASSRSFQSISPEPIDTFPDRIDSRPENINIHRCRQKQTTEATAHKKTSHSARRAEKRKAPLSRYENIILPPVNQCIIFINTTTRFY